MSAATTRILDQRCTGCHKQLVGATDYLGLGKLRPGDIVICDNCGKVTILTKKMKLRNPSRQEGLELSLHPAIMQAQILISGR